MLVLVEARSCTSTALRRPGVRPASGGWRGQSGTRCRPCRVTIQLAMYESHLSRVKRPFLYVVVVEGERGDTSYPLAHLVAESHIVPNLAHFLSQLGRDL